MTTATSPVVIVPTLTAPGFASGKATKRKKAWQARTEDGEYEFYRNETRRESWAPFHASTRTELRWQPSLDDCATYVQSGRAAEDLDRVLAHQRGEHANARDPRCLGGC